MNESEEINQSLRNVREFARNLRSLFVGRERQVEMMMVSAIAQEPLLFVGPPGTGKSELITQFRSLIKLPDEEYFEYTLTKFTEPGEILGPLDLNKMKQGEFFRKTEGKLPQAKLAFLDEVFKANSAILNTLLTILNERKFYQDGRPVAVPLKILFAATNNIPVQSELEALKDRFVFKVKVNPVPEELWDDLLLKGIGNDVARHFKQSRFVQDVASLNDFLVLYKALQNSFRAYLEEGEDPYFAQSEYLEFKRIIKHIKHEYELGVSDRKLIKIYKMLRARALFVRGGAVEREDFQILAHLGNDSEEVEFLEKTLPEILA